MVAGVGASVREMGVGIATEVVTAAVKGIGVVTGAGAEAETGVEIGVGGEVATDIVIADLEAATGRGALWKDR